MTGVVLLDTISRTADILARMETSIMEEDRTMIETLTFDLHSVLSGMAIAAPGSDDERIIAEKIFERTERLEKLLADRMTAKIQPSLRRKLKHKPGRVSYCQ
jgi:heme oxygenase